MKMMTQAIVFVGLCSLMQHTLDAQQYNPFGEIKKANKNWDGDGVEDIACFALGANVDGMFSVWNGKGERLYAISFLPSPYNRMLDNATYKKNLGGTWRAHAMPGGHEGIRRQVDLNGNGCADVIMPFGEWHWGSDSILFLMEGHMGSSVPARDQ